MRSSARPTVFCMTALLSLFLISGCEGGINAGMPNDAGATVKPSLPPEPSGPDLKEIAKRK
ncbi:MAG: hypothetical protein P4L84_31910 [Isosphaeraceae bacterium]|nr:hypothetical protein [Isosphaeraceae bacterium]